MIFFTFCVALQFRGWKRVVAGLSHSAAKELAVLTAPHLPCRQKSLSLFLSLKKLESKREGKLHNKAKSVRTAILGYNT